MRRATVLMIAGLFAQSAPAAEEGLQPGLWEMRVLKQVVDGRDLSGEMSSAMSKMQASLANLPPEQRAQMEAMMRQHGVAASGNGAIRVCVSPEMARRNALPVDKDGHCTSTNVTRTGNRLCYEFACSANGSRTTGKGEGTLAPGRVEMRTDATTQQADGTHTMHTETQMSFVSADCGAVKPAGAPK